MHVLGALRARRVPALRIEAAALRLASKFARCFATHAVLENGIYHYFLSLSISFVRNGQVISQLVPHATIPFIGKETRRSKELPFLLTLNSISILF